MSPWETLLDRPTPRGHLLQLCDVGGRSLTVNLCQYLRKGLDRGDGLLVVGSDERRDAVRRQLEASSVDVEALVQSSQLVLLDAEKTLAHFMLAGQPDWDAFESTIAAAMRSVRPAHDRAGLRVYGEMVGVLWKNRQFSAAVRLEQFWNKLLGRISFTLFCGYSMDVFGKEFEASALDPLLCAHTHLVPGAADGNLEIAVNRAMVEVLGCEADELRQRVKTEQRPSWAVMPGGEAAVVWLRENFPESADAILARARDYCQGAPLLEGALAQ